MTDNERQNTPEFSAELVGAAEHLGIPVLAVEKDYWVTRALRGMTTKHREGFVFKGGTSITKGWRIGRRFSEDIDILVVQRPEPDSVNGRETILRASHPSLPKHLLPSTSIYPPTPIFNLSTCNVFTPGGRSSRRS
ncbi:MAG: nucleotidyl transferase AbiEii/AbiGii toxin family protein [Actinobacteria bacterium]|nr:nucleotidyl transferase AbiEii/AbiGii toxin family protein [Actinomycetota bacterium]